VLAVGILLQMAFFYDVGQTARAPLNPSALISAFFVKNVLVPTLDYRTADALGGALRTMAIAHTIPIAIAVGEVAFVCLGGACLWVRGRRALFWMFMAAVLIAFVSYAASRNGSVDLMIIGAGNRYAFVPEVLFALVLLSVAATGRGWFGRLAQGGVIWLLAVGIAEFHDDSIRHFFIHGPQWTDEVVAWRQDPAHVVRIWPNSWTLDLNTPGPRSVRH
jgi:hypothetical protein